MRRRTVSSARLRLAHDLDGGGGLCDSRSMGASRAATTAGEGADVLTVLRALAEPKRFRILCALRVKERCVRELVDGESIPQPLVSHHLAVLVRARLVRSRRSEGYTMYAVDPEGMAVARAGVADLLDTEVLGPLALPGGNRECCSA